ncbi:ABC transporter ATP-binding protein [uncultured Cohaesibacter sp.]|uniref:ABC transporter ATP-binding protein n=1 Tax=uncultured Cohaesibacter sp. TaxID=1002546 RepID=UPI002931D84B|nr:ABC transporter ATP-binding protein [uncultured Cohaesibacter sp.]
MNTREALDAWGCKGTVGASIAAGISFEGINCSFAEKDVLRDISFRIEPGEVVSLLGQSGAGKTTLLRIAAGIERQTSGTLAINERVVSDDAQFVPPEKRNVGLMFQDYALFPHLTVLRNVMFGLKGLPEKAAEVEARAALCRVGLEDRAEHFPHMLSGGQQQRVALARAIAPRPSVLLMDEPFSGLDNRLRDQVRNETISLLREIGTTCVLVTHDPEEALRISDRILLLRDGRIVQYDRPEVLYRSPVDYWAARFFADLNAVEGVISGGLARTPIGSFSADGFSPRQKVRVCIRRTGVRLHKAISEDYVTALTARVKSRMFLGEVDLYEISIKGCDQPIFAKISSGQSFRKGEMIGVSFRKTDILIFANSF